MNDTADDSYIYTNDQEQKYKDWLTMIQVFTHRGD
jgi:hypothetical protein